MDILLMMWFAMDIVLLIIFFLRKRIPKDDNFMYRRSIENKSSLVIRFLDEFLKLIWFILGSVIVYAVLDFVPNEVIRKFSDWYENVYFVCLFPLIYTSIKERKIKIKSVWEISLVVLLVAFSGAGYFVGEETNESISKYRTTISILISVLASNSIIVWFKTIKIRKEYYSNKLSKKGIRKDLYFRTTNLMINISNIELIKCCERYFTEYMYRYKKIKGLDSVEYVNLSGNYREIWYKKAAHFMKIFTLLSILGTTIDLFWKVSHKHFLLPVLMLIFGVLIMLYKRIDPECLYKMAIRYFYDEWGYYLTCTNKTKFVGIVQLVAVSKFHKYIYSFLDIVALCRAVAFNDKINKDKKISVITDNLSELFVKYTDYNNSQSWVLVIPLWISALYEFHATNHISEAAKIVLKKSVNESTKFKINIFLQSFWAEQQEKKLRDGIAEYINLFQEELHT